MGLVSAPESKLALPRSALEKTAGTTAAALLRSVRTLSRADGSFNGTAFVDVGDRDALDAALLLHQTEIRCADGSRRSVNVREALTKSDLAARGK